MNDASTATRSLELEQEVDASVEDVWELITTSEGLRQWFPLDARVNPEVGGTVWLSWGPGMEAEAPIHVWDPPRQMGWTESYGDDEHGRPIKITVDFYVEGREGQTVVRLVQSGLSASEEWDEMYDALKDGWTYFLFNLGYYFLKHRGQKRSMVWSRVATALTRDAIWERLVGAALIGAAAGPGTSVDLTLDEQRPAEVVSQREGYHFTATLPGLDDSLLFIELEGKHVGLWLSTYDMDDERVELLRTALDERVGIAFDAA